MVAPHHGKGLIQESEDHAMTATDVRTTDRRTVVGVFNNSTDAEAALNALRAAGFRPDQVSVVARNNEDTTRVVENTGMGAEGAATGAVTGGVLGGLAGFLVGISALVIPGIGPIVGSGILIATLAGAGIGAAAGGLIGALADVGVPEEDARAYEEHVKGGRILLTVHADTDQEAQEAHRVLETGRGTDVRAYGTGAAQASMAQIGRTGMATGTDRPISTGVSTGTTTGTGTSGRTTVTSDEMRDTNAGTPGIERRP
jgi:uncharacterized membrane protein